MPRVRPIGKTGGRKMGSLNLATRAIKELAQPHTEEAISTLLRIMRNGKLPAQARCMAAGMLLDRGWGKAHQTSDVSLSDARGYVRAPAKMEKEEWQELLSRRQALAESVATKLPQSKQPALPTADTLRTQQQKQKILQ